MTNSEERIENIERLIESKLEVLIDDAHAKAFESLIHGLIAVSLDKGYHFSDFLEAVAAYAKKQIQRIPEERLGWEIQFCLLKEAAEQAEHEGRKLP